MSQQIKLPFKVQMNASISQLLHGQERRVSFNKQLPIAINRLYKQRMRLYFRRIKNRQRNNSVEGLFRELVKHIKTQKKQQKVSYLHYAVQQLPSQPQVPKTPSFNQRVKSLKQSVFLKLKHYSLQVKHQQLKTILINRQSQLLNYLVPKIQQKILSYGFRKMIEYSKQQKSRFMIIKVLDRLGKVMVKRIGYSEFFNRVRRVRDREDKVRLGARKIGKILRLCARLFMQQSLRQLQLYTQANKLQQSITQKKQLINQVYTKNTQRMSTIQQQRQALRSLKYKLDQQAVQRSHVLTERKRSLMLMKTKFNQQSKLLAEEIAVAGGQVMRLQRIVEKQRVVVQTLEGMRRAVEGNTQIVGIGYEQAVMSIYKQLTQLYQQSDSSSSSFHSPSNTHHLYSQIMQIVKNTISAAQQQQHQTQSQQAIATLQNIQRKWDYQCLRIELLEMIVRSIEGGKGGRVKEKGQKEAMGMKQSVYSQQYVPTTNRSLQQSKFTSDSLLINPTSSSTNTSRVMTNSTSTNKMGKSAFSSPIPSQQQSPQPIQFTRAKQQHFLIEQTISLILKKRYELQMRHAIKNELEELGELLVEDSREQ